MLRFFEYNTCFFLQDLEIRRHFKTNGVASTQSSMFLGWHGHACYRVSILFFFLFFLTIFEHNIYAFLRLGDYQKESGYASGGKMAAPMTDNKPLSYFKYKNEGVEYTLPNFGFNLRLADYDFSQSTQNNRTRNPKVEWIKEARPCGRRP